MAMFAVLFCVFLQVLPALSAIDAPLGKPSHALVWASEPYAKGTDGKVSYKTQTVSSFVTGLFKSLLPSNIASEFFESEYLNQMPPQVVLVAVGQQMREDGQLRDQNAALQKLTSEARSWISVPHLVKEASPGLHIVEQLLETYANSTNLAHSYIAGDCDAEVQGSVVYPSEAKHLQGGVSGAAEFLKGLNQNADEGLVLMLVCLPKEDAQIGEVDAVDTLDGALKSSGSRYVAVYTAEPEAPAQADKELEDRRRSMLQYGETTDSPTAGYNGNDELFFLQVNLLRAFLVVLFTIVALLSGFCCLMSLDTPTRFESARGEGQVN